MPPSHPPFLRRIRLKNYKSIAACDVSLGRLTFLVGPNGSGKSNFLDALRFVADATRYSLDHALRDRGGIQEVRRRSSGHPRHFGIRFDVRLADGTRGSYAFEIGAQKQGGYVIQREECFLDHSQGHSVASYTIEEGKVIQSSIVTPPAAARDRLYLVNVSGLMEFRPLYDAFSRMGFYNLNPDSIRELQSPDPGDLLRRDGGNLASVLARLLEHHKDHKTRIEEYLEKVVPGVVGIDPRAIGPKETLEFRQKLSGADHPWRFLAANMSDGTLRALGVLVALFQAGRADQPDIPLIGLEEPEAALHPAAASVLRDGLREASEHVQVLVTSHSPELLDDPGISSDELLAVVSEGGETKLGSLDDTTRSVLREHLYTAGELLRMDQLVPHPTVMALMPQQLDLFERGQSE